MTHRLIKGSFLVALTAFVAFTSCNKEDLHECLVEVGDEFILMSVTKLPEYIDGEDSLNTRFLRELKYPADAREDGIEGTVLLNYVITDLGTIDTVIIAQDIGGGCGMAAQEAFYAVTPGTSFYPAEIDGMPVTVKKEVPVTFKLE